MRKLRKAREKAARGPFRLLNNLMVLASNPFRQTARDAIAFDIQNVADYYFRDLDRRWTSLDFPNVALPHPVCWFEYAPWSAKDATVAKRLRYGVLAHAIALESKYKRDAEEFCKCSLDIDGAKWATICVIFIARDGHLANGGDFAARLSYITMGDGSIGEFGPRKSIIGEVHPDMLAVLSEGADVLKHAKRGLRVAAQVCHPVLLALSFLHCRNVSVQHVAGTGAAPKQPAPGRSKKRRHNHRYHILEIQPIRKIMDAARATDGEAGAKRALHICRGHWKTFKDRGLFGREDLRGTYWWGSQVRGSKDHGVVAKDYRMAKGEDAETAS